MKCLSCCGAAPLNVDVRSRTSSGASMSITFVRCDCGLVEVQLTDEPMAQYVCHCDDCQAVHGKAYSVALYAATAVDVTRGQISVLTLKTTPRSKCTRCGTFVFAEVPGFPFRGVNGDLLPPGRFNPEFHVQCRFATTRIHDNLPHYKDTPLKFRGSGETMSWSE
jgi:hypothetical protein